MDPFCRRSLFWPTPPFYQPDVTEVKRLSYNRLSMWRGRREGAPTANGRTHCSLAKASSGQFLNPSHRDRVSQCLWLSPVKTEKATHSYLCNRLVQWHRVSHLTCMCPSSSSPQDSDTEIHGELCRFTGLENKTHHCHEMPNDSAWYF